MGNELQESQCIINITIGKFERKFLVTFVVGAAYTGTKIDTIKRVEYWFTSAWVDEAIVYSDCTLRTIRSLF